MLAKLLLPDLAGLELTTIIIDGLTLILELRIVASQAERMVENDLLKELLSKKG